MHQSTTLPQASSSIEQPLYVIRTPPSWLTRSSTSLAGLYWGAQRPQNDAARSGRRDCDAPAAEVRCTMFSVTCRLRWRTPGLVHSAVFVFLSCTRWNHKNPSFAHWLELHGGPIVQLT